MRASHVLLMACAPLLVGGCVGRSRVGAFTTDNLGLSIQSSTPNPEITVSYGRQEGAIEPVFENGATPAVAASVQHTDTALHLSADIKSIFTSGNAAIYATGGEPSKTGHDAVACIHERLPPKTLFEPGQTGALYFGTDTVIGLKASVSTGNSPNIISGKLGYNRQEVSFAPVFQKIDKDPEAACSHDALVDQAKIDLTKAEKDAQYAKEANKPQNEQNQANNVRDMAKRHKDRLDLAKEDDGSPYRQYPVYVPSTFASASDSIAAADAQGTLTGQFKVAQVFATGYAAELIAKGPGNGAIAAVAHSISPPEVSSTVEGPTFVVGVGTKTGCTGAGAITAVAGSAGAAAIPATAGSAVKVSLTPNWPSNSSLSSPPGEPILYTSKSCDTARDIALGLAKAFNADPTASALGLRATPKEASVTLTIPKNLSGFFPAKRDPWNPSPTAGTVTVTPQQSQ